MEPFTLAAIMSGAMYLFDRARERSQARAQQARVPQAPPRPQPPAPPVFSPQQLDRFTSVSGRLRVFGPQVDLPRVLAEYSAVPVDAPEFGSLGRAWLVVPPTPGAERASDVLERARRVPGAVVLGSLTLLLPFYNPAPKVLFVGEPAAAERLAPTLVEVPGAAPRHAYMAVIPSPAPAPEPAAERVETAPVAAESAAPDPEPSQAVSERRPPRATNGAAKSRPPSDPPAKAESEVP